MRFAQKCFFVVLALLLGGAAGIRVQAGTLAPAAKTAMRTSKVKAWDCAGCHKTAQVLPKDHVSTQNMTYQDCQGCHVAGEGQPGTLRGRIPGSHLHALSGVQCNQCHGDGGKREAVPTQQCLGCHGDGKALAERTAAVKPLNPHVSRHYGTDADCNLCHHEHVKSENLCAQCHKFKFIVP